MTKNKIKLLSIDLDGTLLNKWKNISKPDLNSLKKFEEQGGIIIINTGKTLRPTLKIIKKINRYLKDPIKVCSCLNGNIIYDCVKKELISYTYMPKNIFQQVRSIAKQHMLIMGYYRLIGNNKQAINQNIIKTKQNLINPFSKKNFDTYKINLIAKWRTLFNKPCLMDDLENIKEIEVLKTNHRLFEIVSSQSNKGKSLEIVCNYLKVPLDKVGTIGDSWNDVPMFKKSKFSFLVSNKYAKQIAKYATHYIDVKKHRVKRVIDQYCS